jgi:tryptophan halogenase
LDIRLTSAALLARFSDHFETMRPIDSILIVGGGSAGFLTALALRVRFPDLPVTLLRSPELGIIGVGEGTFAHVPKHLHGYLGIDPAEFHAEARPSWKLGTRFLWGRRDQFVYTFDNQVDFRVDGLPRANGYYAFDDFTHASVRASLMLADKVFLRQPNGSPHLDHNFGYHIENELFVAYLEKLARRQNVTLVDGTVDSVRQDEAGVESLVLTDGRRLAADFYVDCSGFASILLGKALGTPFTPFTSTLYCDRAVVGGWERPPGEPILPYTTSETMDAGWCWRIEHPEKVIRGYVYGSAFISDAEAEAEFRRKNPRLTTTRIVKFKTGAYQQLWVKNVMAIGNASGFVEPLEATAIAFVCSQSQALADVLYYNDRVVSDSIRAGVNRIFEDGWANIREFLGVHYRFNDRLQTPFWRACCNDVEIGEAQAIVDYYRAHGPNAILRHVLERRMDMFSLEGFFTILLGLRVPFENRHQPSATERSRWERFRARNEREARFGFTVAEALRIVQLPEWSWNPEFYAMFRPQ